MDYIDDISVYSKTWEEHLQHLEEVFKRLRKAKLKINPDKCHFGAQEIQFLGHVIGIDGIKPDPAKVEKVKNFSQPENTTELRSFVGLISYYRRFIQDFSKISKPLFKLTKKDQPYEWKEPQCKAFEILKEKLINSPVLIYPNFEKEFILLTDASKIALGAILSQKTIIIKNILSRMIAKFLPNMRVTTIRQD